MLDSNEFTPRRNAEPKHNKVGNSFGQNFDYNKHDETRRIFNHEGIEMSTYLLGVTAAAIVFVFTIEIMRRGLIRERFAIIWSVTAAIMMFFSIFNTALVWTSERLSFKTPANMLFFGSTLLLILVAVQYAYELGQLENQNQKMAIEIAIIKNEVKKLSE